MSRISSETLLIRYYFLLYSYLLRAKENLILFLNGIIFSLRNTGSAKCYLHLFKFPLSLQLHVE